MMNHNLYELIQGIHYEDESLFPTEFINTYLSNTPLATWINKYYKGTEDYYYHHIDDYIGDKYGSFIPVTRYNSDDASVEGRYLRNSILTGFFIANTDKLNHIIELSELKYNPINNYDKDEVVTTEYIGSESTVDSIGESRMDVTNGERITTDTNKKSPYNDDTYYNDTEFTSVNGGSSDTTVESAKEDSHTRTFNGRKDIVTIKTSGNIGVTTTTAMMREGIEFWSAYNIVDFIMNKFVAENCILLDD